MGFTSFHLITFIISSVTVALFRKFRPYQNDLGVPSAVKLYACLPLFFQVARTLRSSQSRVSMDFPLRPFVGRSDYPSIDALISIRESYLKHNHSFKSRTIHIVYFQKRVFPNWKVVLIYQNWCYL